MPSVCDRERRRAGDRQRRRRVPGHLARRVEREGDRALARRVRVRTGVVHVLAAASASSRAVRVRQRDVDVLTRAGDEDARAGVLLQRHRERVRLADLVRRVRRDRDPRVHPRLRAPGPSSRRRRPCSASARHRRPTRVVCALTVVTPVTAELSVIVQLPVPPAVVHGFGDVNAPGPLIDREADLRPVRRVHEAAVPSFTFTCAVNVCVCTDPVRRRSA